jgi:large subunit ribosomal protein L33
MAKKNKQSAFIKLKSSESNHYYYTLKNKKNTPGRLTLRKYDPTVGVQRHVEYKEEK